MRLLIDENLPNSLVTALRESGHDAVHVFTEGLQGANDDQVFESACDQNRILLTEDRRFGDVRRLKNNRASGIVVFRFSATDSVTHRVRVIDEFFKKTSQETLAGKITVVDPGSHRSRSHPAV